MSPDYIVAADALLTARQHATTLAGTPRRQWLRRRDLRAQIAAACAIGDAHRDRAAAGAADMLPMRVEIRQQTGV